MNILIPLSIALYSSFMTGWIIGQKRYRKKVSKIMERVQKSVSMNYNNVNLAISTHKIDEEENIFLYFLRKLAEEFDNI